LKLPPLPRTPPTRSRSRSHRTRGGHAAADGRDRTAPRTSAWHWTKRPSRRCTPGASSTSTWGGPCGGVCVYRPGAAGIQGAAYSEPGAARRQASRRRCQLGVPTTSLRGTTLSVSRRRVRNFGSTMDRCLRWSAAACGCSVAISTSCSPRPRPRPRAPVSPVATLTRTARGV